ncbi:hypothetical protein CYMTET_50826 [Cymbomonas tetramitiformis]|uniref:Uncharacterized protein n=1 Tax=Cymbomonas tetramitiformis TaxID=36881 RepID=A0AAE0ESR8_9CHLO|nr:hypothetical protein CYMTET_50826 [Cymbomonas tetramitiformis]
MAQIRREAFPEEEKAPSRSPMEGPSEEAWALQDTEPRTATGKSEAENIEGLENVANELKEKISHYNSMRGFDKKVKQFLNRLNKIEEKLARRSTLETMQSQACASPMQPSRGINLSDIVEDSFARHHAAATATPSTEAAPQDEENDAPGLEDLMNRLLPPAST